MPPFSLVDFGESFNQKSCARNDLELYLKGPLPLALQLL
jgi:hypothetical protein